MITRERLQSPSIEDALSRAMNILDGAYSLVLMSSQKLICARDPFGFRPLCYGKTADGAYVVASESCAIKAVGAEVIRDVEPGEILVFSKNGVVSQTRALRRKKRKNSVSLNIFTLPALIRSSTAFPSIPPVSRREKSLQKPIPSKRIL